jgi:hypothetical protein
MGVTWFWPTFVALLAAAVVCTWMALARRVSRDRAIEVLHWIERMLAGRGHVTGIRWVSANEFEVPVKLTGALFRGPSFVVSTTGASPWRWISGKKQRAIESVTFRSDFDPEPNFAMQMRTMRWFARSSKNVPDDGWMAETSQPVVLTTRLDWQKEITGTMRSLLSCDERDNLDLKFQKNSPHFSATMSMEDVNLRQQPSCAFFEVLCSVAESASARA